MEIEIGDTFKVVGTKRAYEIMGITDEEIIYYEFIHPARSLTTSKVVSLKKSFFDKVERGEIEKMSYSR